MRFYAYIMMFYCTVGLSWGQQDSREHAQIESVNRLISQAGDDFVAKRYPSGSQTDLIGPKRGSFRVSRGGSWRGDAGHCFSASRCGDLPTCSKDHRGFRVCCVQIEE